MSKLCVIGASGFLGSHVVTAALAKGYIVHGAFRGARDESKSAWLYNLPNATKDNLKVFYGNLDEQGSFGDAIKGCDSVVVCAFPEKPSNAGLIETVVGGAKHILASCLEHGVKQIVLTSSGGSTNPKEGEPALKNELLHWSDSDYQISQGKFSPAAKTLMDRAALEHAEQHPQLRVVILNPNGIIGPCLSPNPQDVWFLAWMAGVIKGERMKSIPGGSMSLIDVRDLALLALAGVENKAAKGRYFGVLKSFPWETILGMVHDVYPAYVVPQEKNYEGEVKVTQFDLSRRDSLGVELRPIQQTFKDCLNCIKEHGMI